MHQALGDTPVAERWRRKGISERPSTSGRISSRARAWSRRTGSGSWRREETVHQDTGLLGFTTEHIYFSDPRKKFRFRYDSIVDFDPFRDEFG